jgi:tRNA dimethylallyltransferase
MFRDGLIDEVRGLIERYAELSKQAGQAIGYRETIAWLAAGNDGEPGERDIVPLLQEIDLHTRQFAKRQETWLKRFPAAIKIQREGARDPDGAELRAAIDRIAEAWERVVGQPNAEPDADPDAQPDADDAAPDDE